MVALALLFLLTGLVAADEDIAVTCSAEWEACAADPKCLECNTTSVCDYVYFTEATCADVDTTLCCTLDADEECGNNEAYLSWSGKCWCLVLQR